MSAIIGGALMRADYKRVTAATGPECDEQLAGWPVVVATRFRKTASAKSSHSRLFNFALVNVRAYREFAVGLDEADWQCASIPAIIRCSPVPGVYDQREWHPHSQVSGFASTNRSKIASALGGDNIGLRRPEKRSGRLSSPGVVRCRNTWQIGMPG